MNFPPGFWSSIKWFTRSEWRHDPSKAAPALVKKLDQVRDLTTKTKPPKGVPIHILVCWAEDGHSPKSYHYSGQAVDFYFGSGLSVVEEFLLISSISGFGGIGYYPHWTPRPGWHIDLRDHDEGKLYWYHTPRLGYQYGVTALATMLESA